MYFYCFSVSCRLVCWPTSGLVTCTCRAPELWCCWPPYTPVTRWAHTPVTTGNSKSLHQRAPTGGCLLYNDWGTSCPSVCPAGFCLRLRHQELHGVLRSLLRLHKEASEVLRQPRPADGEPAVGDAAPPEGPQVVPEEVRQLTEDLETMLQRGSGSFFFYLTFYICTTFWPHTHTLF